MTVIDPGEGELASHGEHGVGRLAEPAELLAACEAALRGDVSGAVTPTWLGARVLVTAGGTREPIDSVRYIGNRSSGRMGFALAAGAARRGAEVTLVAANVALDPPAGVKLVTVGTAAELKQACEAEFDRADVLLMAAAVADFRPPRPPPTSSRRTAGPPQIELEPTEDVLSALAARRRPGQVLVGFAAEHGEGALDYARDKLERKRLDAVVVNDISNPEIGFDAPDNEVTVLIAGGAEHKIAKTGKDRVAERVLNEVEALRARKESERSSRPSRSRSRRKSLRSLPPSGGR